MAMTDAHIAQKTEGFSGESGWKSPAMPVTVIRPRAERPAFVERRRRRSGVSFVCAWDDKSEHLPSAALERKVSV